MKNKLLNIATGIALLAFPNTIFAQAPELGTAASFVLFTTAGAVTNVGVSHLTSKITGNVGTNSGSSTDFGNVNGQMVDGGTLATSAAADLLIAYDQLDTSTADYFFTISPVVIGNGDTLTAGVYYSGEASSMDQTLFLDGEGNTDAVFIFKIDGAFATNANSKVKLINGAQACNVFWKVEGSVNLNAGTTMRGTIVAHNAAIFMSSGDTLEGRALAIAGAISIDGIMAYTPIGCGSPTLTGPNAPALGTTECYGIFSRNGSVTNADSSEIMGDVGTNVGLTTGYDTAVVTGAIHPIPDGSTAQCAADLLNVYAYLNTLPIDIELVYPAELGHNLVLTPHVYLMDAAASLTDTLYLNGLGSANAKFVLHINGALATSTFSKVVLTNGTDARNVYWVINGAVDINDYSEFKGTIVCNNGAINLRTGVILNGRALTTDGAVSTTDITTIMAPVCTNPPTSIASSVEANNVVSIYPNPFTASMVININDASLVNNSEIKIYNVLGALVLNTAITEKTTTLEANLPAGVYFYKVISNNKTVQSGKLVAKQ